MVTYIPCFGVSILKYGGCKLQQDWESVTQFIDMREASYMRQLRALEVFVPDVNPALAPVYIGQCTGMQEDFAPLSHNNC